MIFTVEEIILYVLAGTNVLFIFWLIRLELKSRDIKILKNREGLRNKIISIDDEIANLHQFESKTANKFLDLEDKLGDSIQNIEVLRFNPFKDNGVGGDQSFAATLVNKKGDGLVISSLYARDNVRVFAKPVKAWQSAYELSEEEMAALEKTKASI
ncbi:MAG: DUF4446 family protein [Patescibacteria group bacterium]|nr:DUF4446 family protein [Patescibacteria group bacterium]